jgi:hypothetical protein
VSTDKVYKQRKVYSVTGRAGAAQPALDRGLAQWRQRNRVRGDEAVRGGGTTRAVRQEHRLSGPG